MLITLGLNIRKHLVNDTWKQHVSNSKNKYYAGTDLQEKNPVFPCANDSTWKARRNYGSKYLVQIVIKRYENRDVFKHMLRTVTHILCVICIEYVGKRKRRKNK